MISTTTHYQEQQQQQRRHQLQPDGPLVSIQEEDTAGTVQSLKTELSDILRDKLGVLPHLTSVFDIIYAIMDKYHEEEQSRNYILVKKMTEMNGTLQTQTDRIEELEGQVLGSYIKLFFPHIFRQKDIFCIFRHFSRSLAFLGQSCPKIHIVVLFQCKVEQKITLLFQRRGFVRI